MFLFTLILHAVCRSCASGSLTQTLLVSSACNKVVQQTREYITERPTREERLQDSADSFLLFHWSSKHFDGSFPDACTLKLLTSRHTSHYRPPVVHYLNYAHILRPIPRTCHLRHLSAICSRWAALRLVLWFSAMSLSCFAVVISNLTSASCITRSGFTLLIALSAFWCILINRAWQRWQGCCDISGIKIYDEAWSRATRVYGRWGDNLWKQNSVNNAVQRQTETTNLLHGAIFFLVNVPRQCFNLTVIHRCFKMMHAATLAQKHTLTLCHCAGWESWTT